MIGKAIGNTRATLDAFGSRLAAAALPGDGFRSQHLHEMGVRVRTEVYGLFAAALPQQAQDVIARWPRRKRQGLVPDFMIALPSPGQSPGDAHDELFELKTLHHGISTYPDRDGRAVNRRADAVIAQMNAKARQLDQRFNATAAGEVGPVEGRLAAFGPVRGIVIGHFAEGSDHLEALLTGAAHCGALRHWAGMRAREPADAHGTMAWLLRRRWGMTAWRSIARLLLDRLEYVGQGSMLAHARRAAASEAADAARRSAHWFFRRPVAAR